MKELNLPGNLKNKIQDFIEKLKDLYHEDVVSVILYGSAASGEFVDKRSNLNLLVVLKNTDLLTLKIAAGLIRKFSKFHPIFLTEQYITTSNDIFPIEFLDMKENYSVLFGKDVLSGISIDTRNLRFQCEQELKIKLLGLRNAYLALHKNKAALREILFKALTSVLHISRNLLRLEGRAPAYKKEQIIKELAQEFQINAQVWERALAAKNKSIALRNQDVEPLFLDFYKEVDKITAIVDRL